MSRERGGRRLRGVRGDLSDGVAAHRRRRWSRPRRACVALGPDLTGVLYRRTSARPARATSAWSPRRSPSGCRRSPRSTSPCAGSTPSRTPARRSSSRSSSPASTSCLALLAYAVLPLRWQIVGMAAAYAVTYDVGLGPVHGGPAPPDRRAGRAPGRADVRPACWPRRPPAAVAWLASWLVGRSPRRRRRRLDCLALAAGGVVLLAGYIAAGPAPAGAGADALIGTVRCTASAALTAKTEASAGRSQVHASRAADCAASSRRTPGHERGDIVLSWLTKLVARLRRLAGIVLFDAISVGTTAMNVCRPGLVRGPRGVRGWQATEERPEGLRRRGRGGHRAEPAQRRRPEELPHRRGQHGAPAGRPAPRPPSCSSGGTERRSGPTSSGTPSGAASPDQADARPTAGAGSARADRVEPRLTIVRARPRVDARRPVPRRRRAGNPARRALPPRGTPRRLAGRHTGRHDLLAGAGRAARPTGRHVPARGRWRARPAGPARRPAGRRGHRPPVPAGAGRQRGRRRASTSSASGSAASNLAGLVADGPLPAGEARSLTAEIAAAMSAAHDAGPRPPVPAARARPAHRPRAGEAGRARRGRGGPRPGRGTTRPTRHARDARGVARRPVRRPHRPLAGSGLTALPPAPCADDALCSPRQVRAGVPARAGRDRLPRPADPRPARRRDRWTARPSCRQRARSGAAAPPGFLPSGQTAAGGARPVLPDAGRGAVRARPSGLPVPRCHPGVDGGGGRPGHRPVPVRRPGRHDRAGRAATPRRRRPTTTAARSRSRTPGASAAGRGRHQLLRPATGGRRGERGAGRSRDRP